MKFICSICEASGEISEGELERPLTRAICQNCGTILIINPDTGKVVVHASPLKGSSAIETSGNRSTDSSDSVLSMSPRGRTAKDWTAVVVVAGVLLVLISTGIYLAFNWI
ncbi:MAG: hypothetical protein P8185_07200 [Deltaproteobacteria bacterium]|jgi:hypothetical protein